MKTLTEFSGTIVRMAAKGLAEAKAALPAPVEGAEAPAADANVAAFSEAISKETGITGDRLERLREAMEAVGDKAINVRVVRVYAGEEAVPGAKKVGAHHYIVDLMPESMKQISARPEKKREGRGDRDRGPKRAEGSLSGSFSMDSIKEDRGGGRRGPGGPPKGPGGPAKT